MFHLDRYFRKGSNVSRIDNDIFPISSLYTIFPCISHILFPKAENPTFSHKKNIEQIKTNRVSQHKPK